MVDVLIIGGGGSGLVTALELRLQNKNLNIKVVSKTTPTASATTQAQGGINAVLYETKDSVAQHIEDTIKGAKKDFNKEAIEYMCNNAKDSVLWLDGLGVAFSRTNTNQIAQRKLGGAKYPRACYSSDYTGLKIMHTLYDQVINRNIEVAEELMLLQLIKDEQTNTIKGAIFLEIATSKLKTIYAKTIVLATGGYAGIYHRHTTNTTANTADGLSSAIDIGCEVEQLSNIQFHPTALEKLHILISESARGEGGYLINSDNERFVDELDTRDVVSKAIFTQLRNNKKVYLDLRNIGIDKIKQTMPQEYNIISCFTSYDIAKDPIPIVPTAHYSIGGIKTDLDGKTNIQNLFAVGEVASNKVHGINRLGGNSLLELVVFGRRTAQYINSIVDTIQSFDTQQYDIQTTMVQKRLDDIFNMPNKISFYELKDNLGTLLYETASKLYTEDKIDNLQEKFDNIIKQSKQIGLDDKSKLYNTELKELIEFENILKVSSKVVLDILKKSK